MILAPISVFSCLINKNSINAVNSAEETLDVGINGTHNYLTKSSRGYWKIEDETDFRGFVTYANDHNGAYDVGFELTCPISVHSSDTIINEFRGYFYGGNYTIYGLSCFTKINYGTIYNLVVCGGSINFSDNASLEKRVASYSKSGVSENANLDDNTYFSGAGIIASVNLGSIEYCGVYDSSVSISGSSVCAGAIAGVNVGIITSSYSYGNGISASASGGSEDAVAGGIAGYLCGGGNVSGCISAENGISGVGLALNAWLLEGMNITNSDDYSAGGIVGGAVIEIRNEWESVLSYYPTTSGSFISYCYGSNNLEYEMCPIDAQFNFSSFITGGDSVQSNSALYFTDNYTGSSRTDLLSGSGSYTTTTYKYDFVGDSTSGEISIQIGPYYARKPGFFNPSFGTVTPAGEYKNWWTSGEYSRAETENGGGLQAWLSECMYRLVNTAVTTSGAVLQYYWEIAGSTVTVYFYEDDDGDCSRDEGETLINSDNVSDMISYLEGKGYLAHDQTTDSYTFEYNGKTDVYKSSRTYYELKVISDASAWKFPTDTSDHYGYPYFGESTGYQLNYYNTSDDFRSGTLTKVSVSKDDIFSTGENGGLYTVNKAVKGTYNENDVFEVISCYRVYKVSNGSVSGTSLGEIFKVENSGDIVKNDSFNLTSLKEGMYAIVPVYIELAPTIGLSMNYHFPSVESQNSSVKYSVLLADDSEGNNALINIKNSSYVYRNDNGTQDINMDVNPENLSVFSTPKRIKIETDYKMAGETGGRASYVYAYFEVGQMNQFEFLNDRSEDDPESSNVYTRYGKFSILESDSGEEFGGHLDSEWTAGKLKDGYYKELKLTLVVHVYAEMDIVAHVNEAEFPYNVLYSTNCTFVRNENSFSSRPVPRYSGTIMGYFDAPNGTGTQVTDGQLNFISSKYFTTGVDGEGYYRWNENPLHIYALINTRTGTKTYTFNTYKTGGTLKAETQMRLAVSIHLYFQYGSDSETMEWYYNSTATGGDTLSDTEWWNYVEAGSSSAFSLHYPDSDDPTHWIMFNNNKTTINTADTVMGPNGETLLLNRVEFKVKGSVLNSTRGATYMIANATSIDEDTISVSGNNSTVSNSVFGIYFPSGSFYSETWTPDADSEYDVCFAELQAINLYDTIWSSSSTPEGTIYQVSGTNIRTNIEDGLPGGYTTGLKGFVNMSALKNGLYITVDDNDKGYYADNFGDLLGTEVTLDLNASYNSVTVHYVLSGLANDYQTTNWSSETGGYYLSVSQSAQMMIPYNVEFSPMDDTEKTFKGWFATSEKFSSGKYTSEHNIVAGALTTTKIKSSWIGGTNSAPVMYIYESWVDGADSGETGNIAVTFTIHQKLDSKNGDLLGTVTKTLYYNKSGSQYILVSDTAVVAPNLTGYTFSEWGGYSAGSYFEYSDGTLSLSKRISVEPKDLLAYAVYTENTQSGITSFRVYYGLHPDNTMVDAGDWTEENGRYYCVITEDYPYIATLPTVEYDPSVWIIDGGEYDDRTMIEEMDFWDNYSSWLGAGESITIEESFPDFIGSTSVSTLTVQFLLARYTNYNSAYPGFGTLEKWLLDDLTIDLKIYQETYMSMSTSQYIYEYYILYDTSYAEYCYDETPYYANTESGGSIRVARIDLNKYFAKFKGYEFLFPYDEYLSNAGLGLLEHHYSTNGLESEVELTNETLDVYCGIMTTKVEFNVRVGNLENGDILETYTYYAGLNKLAELGLFGSILGEYAVTDSKVTTIHSALDYITDFEDTHGVMFNSFLVPSSNENVMKLSPDNKKIEFVSLTEDYHKVKWGKNRSNTTVWIDVEDGLTELSVKDVGTDFAGDGMVTIYFGSQIGDDDSSRGFLDQAYHYLFQYSSPESFEGVAHTKYEFDALNGWSASVDLNHQYVSFGFDLSSSEYFNMLTSGILKEAGCIRAFYSYSHDGTNLIELDGDIVKLLSDEEANIGNKALLKTRNETLSDISKLNLAKDFCIYLIMCAGEDLSSKIQINFMRNSPDNIYKYDTPFTLNIPDINSSNSIWDGITFTPFKDIPFVWRSQDADISDVQLNSLRVEASSIAKLVAKESYYQDWFVLDYNSAGEPCITFIKSKLLEYIQDGGTFPKDIELTVCYNWVGYIFNNDSTITSSTSNKPGNFYEGVPTNCTLIITRLVGVTIKNTTIKVVNGEIKGANKDSYYEMNYIYASKDYFSGNYKTLSNLSARTVYLHLDEYYYGSDSYLVLKFYSKSGTSYTEYDMYDGRDYLLSGGLLYVTALSNENYAEINVEYEGLDSSPEGGMITLYYSDNGPFGYNFNENYVRDKAIVMAEYDTNGVLAGRNVYNFVGWKITLEEGDANNYLKLFNLTDFTYDETLGYFVSTSDLKTCSQALSDVSGAFKIKLIAVYEKEDNILIVTINYIDENGQSIAESGSYEYRYSLGGETEKVEPIAINGYQCTLASVSNNMFLTAVNNDDELKYYVECHMPEVLPYGNHTAVITFTYREIKAIDLYIDIYLNNVYDSNEGPYKVATNFSDNLKGNKKIAGYHYLAGQAIKEPTVDGVYFDHWTYDETYFSYSGGELSLRNLSSLTNLPSEIRVSAYYVDSSPKSHNLTIEIIKKYNDEAETEVVAETIDLDYSQGDTLERTFVLYNWGFDSAGKAYQTSVLAYQGFIRWALTYTFKIEGKTFTTNPVYVGHAISSDATLLCFSPVSEDVGDVTVTAIAYMNVYQIGVTCVDELDREILVQNEIVYSDATAYDPRSLIMTASEVTTEENSTDYYIPPILSGYEFNKWGEVMNKPDGWDITFYDESGHEDDSLTSKKNMKINTMGDENRSFSIKAIYNTDETIKITVDYLNDNGAQIQGADDDIYEYFYEHTSGDKPISAKGYSVLTVGDSIQYRTDILGHSTFIGWQIEEEYLSIFGLTISDVNNLGYVAQNVLTVASLVNYTGEQAISIKAMMRPDVARIEVVRSNDLGVELTREKYEFYYSSKYESGNDDEYNILNVGQYLPTEREDSLFSRWDLLSSSTNYSKFFDDNIMLKANNDVYGVWNITLYAIYEANVAIFTTRFSTDNGATHSDEISYTFYYTSPGYNGTLDDNENFNYVVNTNDFNSRIFKFDSYTVEHEKGGANPTSLYTISGESLISHAQDIATCKGRYEIIFTAKYIELDVAVINVCYRDKNRATNESSIEEEQYIFYYANNKPLTVGSEFEIGSGETIIAKNLTGYYFINWLIPDSAKAFFMEYTSGDTITTCEAQPEGADGYYNFTLIAYYEVTYYKIEIDYVDELGNKINADITSLYYYYNGSVETVTDKVEAGYEYTAPNKLAYVFMNWTTDDEIYGYVEFNGDKLIVKESSETLPSAIYTLHVHCVYKSTADLYIQVNVKNYYWEEKEYNDNLVSIGEDKTIKLYYYGKEMYLSGEWGPGHQILASGVSGYTFKFFETSNLTVDVLSEAITVAIFGDMKSFTYLGGTLIKDKTLSDINKNPSAYKVTNSFYTKCTFNSEEYFSQYYSILDQYLLENGNGTLTLDINAYHSKPIILRDDSANITLEDDFNVPINYIINNDNFAGALFTNGTRPANKTFNYNVPCKVKYSFDTTAQLYSDETYITSTGENYKFISISSCDYSKPILDNSFDSSTNSLYNFLNDADFANYIPNGFIYDGGWNFEVAPSNGYEDDGNLQAELISRLTALVDENALPDSINVHTPQTLYIQWKANTNTVHCITPLGQFDLTFMSSSGDAGEVLFDFDQAMRENITFNDQMLTYYGTYSTSWKVVRLGDDSCYYNSQGSAVNLNDLLDYVYKNSYGEIYLELVIEDYVKSVFEFNYGLSDRIYTDGNIYTEAGSITKKSDSKITYYLDNNITYASIVNLSDLLNALYQDPNPVVVEYGDDVFYLAGWTFSENYFNPETWNSVDLDVYKTIVNANNANCAYFKRIISGKNNTLYTNSDNPIISYDGTLNYLYGNKTATVNGVENVAVIPMYAVWMPYYELNLHTNNLDSSISGDIYDGNTKLNETGTAYSHAIYYGRTLQMATDMILSYDVLTLIGETPTITGLNIGKEGYFLKGYNILGNTDYGYAGSWNIDKTTPYYALTMSGNISYVDFAGIYKSFINYIKSKSSFNGLGIKIDVYPIWEGGVIDVSVDKGNISHYNGEYSAVTTSVPLVGSYCLDTYTDSNDILKTRYSVKDIIITDTAKTVPICGTSFNYRLYIENISTALAEIDGVERCVLKLDCKANYAGNMYFLKIYGLDNLDDNVEQQITESMAVGEVKTLDEFTQTYVKVGTELTTSEQAVSKVNVMSMYTYPAKSGNYYSYIDSSEMYNSIKNKIIKYNDVLYLCLAYGDDVEYDTEGQRGETKLQTLKKGATDLGYYAYFGTQNDTVYCYDVKNGTGLIRYSGINKVLTNYTGTKNPTCESYWVPNGDIYEYSIGAIWDLRQYDIDLSVQLEELGTTADTNSGYLVAEVRYDDPKLADKYYVLNYEKDGVNYEYNLYELTESEYTGASRYYNGWNELGLTPTKSNKIIVFAGAKVTIKAFDQSKDSYNDCMIGYRLERTEILNPEASEANLIDVTQNEWVTWMDGTPYINVNGYTSELDFTTVDMPDKSVISYKVVLTKISYELKVFTENGLMSIIYRQVEYRNKESYEFTTINVGDSLGAQYYPYLGYELDAWRLNTINNYSGEYYILCEINAQFLRDYVYSSNVYSVAKEQDVGELEAIGKLIEFIVRINVVDRNSSEEIASIDLPNEGALLSVTEKKARAIGDLSSISLGGDYIMSIVYANLSKDLKSGENIYLSYLKDGKYYALLSMYVKGKLKNYSDVSFDFPTENYADISLTLDTQTLEDLVTFTVGEPVAEQNRFITVRIECAEIFKVGTNVISKPTSDDIKKGTRSLIGGAYSTILATGSEGNDLLTTSEYAYAYENQEVELKISAPTNYYIGARVSSAELDMEATLALSDSLRFSITQDTYWDVIFLTKTYNYEIVINYREKDYALTELDKVKNIAGENIINISPTVSVTSADGKTTRLSTYYFSDILTLTLAENWLVSNDYNYSVVVNGRARSERTFEFTQDIKIKINIFDLESAVTIYKNIGESAEVIVKSTTQEAKEIDGASTVGFSLIAGESLTAYFKLNSGYQFVNVEHINGTTETMMIIPTLVTDGIYAGYSMISLIDNFSSEKGGQYMLNFEELRYEVEFVYYAHNTKIENPGGKYTASKTLSGKDTYTMNDSVIISNEGKISEGYRFIGYTIGGTVEEGQTPIASGAEKNVELKLADYGEIISNDGKLIIYVNFIYQYMINVNVRDNFGQTKIRINKGVDDPLTGTQCLTIDRAGEYSTKYYDETIYSNERYILRAESSDIEHYYVRIWLVDGKNKIELKSGDEGVEVVNIAGTSYLNRIYYAFDLDKNYTFEIEYMPRDYAVKLGEYYYHSIGQLEGLQTAKINETGILSTELDKNLSVKEAEQIEIIVSADNPSLLNCYMTTLNVVIKVKADNGTKQYEFDKLTLNGETQIGEMSEADGWVTISFTIQIEAETEINVHYKQIYIVEVDCGQAELKGDV